jgi:outer membrane biosynthesis protein TonB
MIPQSRPKPKRNSSKAVFHGLIIAALLYFAARQGYLGKQLKEITVYKVKEEKPPPPPPEKKIEPPKEEPKPVELPKVVEAPKLSAAPVAAAPVVAPAATEVPDFVFNDGAKAVNSESDPVQLYKGYIEYTLRSKWDRPEDLPDDQFAAEVAVSVDPQGNLRETKWLQGSGNARWDASVQEVLKAVTAIDRPPPTNFPPAVVIRFDVEEQTEPVLP